MSTKGQKMLLYAENLAAQVVSVNVPHPKVCDRQIILAFSR